MKMNEAVFERVKHDALEYIGFAREPEGELEKALKNAVAQGGKALLLDRERLEAALRQEKVSPVEIAQLTIMTQIEGFRDLLEAAPQEVQGAAERYLQNAMAQSGLDRSRLLCLTGCIARVWGLALPIWNDDHSDGLPVHQVLGSLSQMRFEGRLDAFVQQVQEYLQRRRRGEAAALHFDELTPLVQLGIPRAQRYEGYCLLKGIGVEKNIPRALELLEAAAKAGDPEAALALGDHYYDCNGPGDWNRAYEYYTGWGAGPIVAARQQRIGNMLNRKKYNQKLLGICVLLFLAMAATVVLAPGAGTIAPLPLLGWAALALQGTALGISLLHHRVKPFEDVSGLSLVMTVVWVAYMAARLWVG